MSASDAHRVAVWRIVLAVVITPLILTGCGYRITSSSHDRMPAGSTVWVSFIQNATTNPGAQTVIRRVLIEELHASRGLVSASDVSSADFRLDGRIVSLSSRIVSYTPTDQAREYRLTADVELDLHRRGEERSFWKGTLQASSDFPAGSDLALQRNAEEAALLSLSRTLAGRLLSAVEQAY